MVIAVTGLGCVCPLGVDPESAANNYLSGQTSISVLGDSWASNLPSRLASLVNFDVEAALGPFLSNRLDRSSQLAVLAARQAWTQSALGSYKLGDRLAIIIGTGIGGQCTSLHYHDVFNSNPNRRGHPLAVVSAMPNAAAAQLAIEFEAYGGAHTPVSACSSGAEAIAWARLMLESDLVDAVVVGGTESVIHPMNFRGFSEMRALSQLHDDPSTACKPFAKDRCGFVLGEGAAVMVLERSADAVSRSAAIHGFLLGSGMTCDSHHLAVPNPEGTHAATAMKKAMQSAKCTAEDIAFISAHATGTSLGDLAEARAIHLAFGDKANDVYVTAPKANVGHLLGASGVVESLFTLIALREKRIPQSLNCLQKDPDIALSIASEPHLTIAKHRKYALKNTFGFGGHNVSLVWSAAE